MNHIQESLIVLVIIIFTGFQTFAQSPLNWNIDEINPGEDFTLNADEAFFTEGQSSLRMQLHSGAVPYLASYVFYITPGAEYEFSVDVFDNDTAGQVKVYADFYDTYGFDVFGQPPVFSSDSSGWQTIKWEGIVPGPAVVAYVLIKFYCQPDPYHFIMPAVVWIDNVEFKEAGGENLITNGGFESWNVGVEENGYENEALSVYPNPAKEFIFIDLPTKVTAVIISDMTGREVFKKKVSGERQLQVDLVHLTDGLYQVIVCLENNPILRKKFIKL